MIILAKNNESPKGWVETNIGSVGEIIHYGYTATSTKKDTGTKYLRITDIQNNNVDWNEVPFCKISEKDKPNFLLHENDIVFARTGGTVGKSFLIKKNIPSAVFASYLIRVVLTEHTNPKFIHLFFQSGDYWHQIQKNKTGLKTNVNAQILSKLVFQLPPLNEQKRIVEKIEELFLELDKNKNSIMNVKIQLKQYVQSLLKSAFEGKLTEQWREKHSGKIIHIDEFINILKKSNSDKNQKFDEVKQEFVSKLEKIPSEWRWVYLSNLGELHRGKSKHRPRNDPILFGGKYPFIQTGVVRNSNGKITSFEQTYNDVGLAQSRLFPKGTICITIAANIADTALLTFPSCFPDSIVGYNGVQNLVENMFIMYYIKSKKTNLESIAPSTAQKNINLDILQKILIPIMSNDEQKEIVAKIDQGFSLLDNTYRAVDSTLQTLQTMKMSILKQAFEGKLVPQDPNDEPASDLLQKIQLKIKASKK